MADVDLEISAMPSKMVNTGNCKSKILVSLKEDGRGRSKAWLYLGANGGEFYGLEDTKTSEEKDEEFVLIKARTNNEGHAVLGLNLPNKVGIIRLVAALEKETVKSVLVDGEVKDKVAVAVVNLESDKPNKVVLEAGESQVVADGVSTTKITATIMDQHGNPIKGEEVSFDTSLGSFDTESMSTVTNGNGQAFATIMSESVGPAKIQVINRYKSWIEDLVPGLQEKETRIGNPFKNKPTATAKEGHPTSEDALMAEMEIEFVPSYASNIILGVDNNLVPADGKTEAIICAQIKDEFGNPVKGSTVVFETDLGEIGPGSQMITDSEGRAEVVLTSTQVGPASVRVQMEGQERLLSATQVVFEAASPANISLSGGSEVVAADGQSEFLIRAEVMDEMGNPVPGRNVEFETNLGSMIPSEICQTDKAGVAEVRCISRNAGKARIRATCNQAKSEIGVVFEAGKASSVAISLNPTVEEEWRNRIPGEHWKKMKEAIGHLEERRFSEAINILKTEEDKSVEISDFPALCNLAFAYQQSGRVEDAERIYRSIIEGNGSRREIRVKADGIEEVFGVVLPQVNGNDRSDLEFIDISPRDFLINVVVTDLHGNHIPDLEVEFSANFGWVPEDFKKGKTNVVGAASSLVTTFSPPGSSEVEFAWVNLGKMKENSLDYTGAEECYRWAIKSMSNSTRGLEALASVLVKIGNSDGAKKCYYNLASNYSKRGQLNRALEYYGKAIELDPKYAKALAGYGATCLKVGEMDRARRYLEESVRVDKTLKASLANLGLVYYLTGNFEDAVKSNRRALKLDPAYKPALLNMHQIHMARGERDKAVEFATKIKALG